MDVRPPEPLQPVPITKPEVVVVGIGASAGGLHALRDFFAHVPDESGLAYVVVVHLSPEHESHLADLLQANCRMPVLQVSDTIALKPDCVYVIPPNANLSAIDTHLRLSPLEERRAARAPIDHFFRTLAQTHEAHAIGVVLTGTGSDGALGIKEIKLHGGLTLAQDPNEAEYDGMPQSAIATGFVDLVLPVANIPIAVLRYATTEPRLPDGRDDEPLDPANRVLLQKVFTMVRARTGRDFSRYKRSTILRRLQRRMQLRYVETLEQYVELLRQSAEEVRALADDMLINVTSFFRDSQVFDRLRADIVPLIFDGKGPDDEVRIWCVGCSTGEEAYSIAMLAQEEAAKSEGLAPRIHVFASDLHERSLEMARDGYFSGDIAADVPAERLKRYFNEESGGYRIRKEVRDSIVFTPHNVLGDPPFSRLDLVLCRNVLIYLQRDVHADVLRILHYALRPGGYLVLGTAETVDDPELFRAVDKRHSIYRRSSAPLPEARLPVFPIVRRSHSMLAEPSPAARAATGQFEAIHAAMLEQYGPPNALIGAEGQVVWLSAEAGRYFEHPAGRMTASAGKLVRKELSLELTTALHQVRRDRKPTRTKPVEVYFDKNRHLVALHVRPALDAQFEGYCLVIFEEHDLRDEDPADKASRDNPPVKQLQKELQGTRHRLQTIIEEFETTQEEMKAANEELQSTNEELRSTMEELETSKEELQSMNEELQTVNQENRHKVDELALLSADLQNLLSATDIATLFLDRDLRILRFTPKVEELFNMRTIDRGRPVSDLTHRLGYEQLVVDAEQVLKRLARFEREVQAENGRWYLTHLLPYRGVNDRIEGVVITFTDITRRKKSEKEIQQLSGVLEQRVSDRTRQVRELTTSLIRAEQRERRRLSETLHDELQQFLYGVQLKLSLVREEDTAGRKAESAQHLREAEALLAKSTRITRQLSVDLNPPILKHEGLRAILTWLQGHMHDLHGLELSLDAEEEVIVADSDVRVLLFQVFRELLFNIAKHSGAKEASVSLRRIEGELVVGIRDDGKGFDGQALFDENTPKASVGLRSVRERIGLLGGRMEVSSSPGEGTSIVIRVPTDAKIGG